MIKHGIDQEALIEQFSAASAKQGEAIRKAVGDATLKALQGRELTLSNIRQVLNTVAKAASTGAASSPLGATDLEALLSKAVAGMDAALEKAVQANRKALSKWSTRRQLARDAGKKALAESRVEDTCRPMRRRRGRAARSRVRGPAVLRHVGKARPRGRRTATARS